MPARKKKDQAALPGTQTTAELHRSCGSAADKLRGSMDAGQYKDFVLGLVFLKYVSDAFDERREQIRADSSPTPSRGRVEPFLDDRDEYTARWRLLGPAVPAGTPGGPGQERGHRRADRPRDGRDHEVQPDAATGVLPKIFNRDNVDQRRLGELVDLISDAGSPATASKKARDVLGEVYEYFLESSPPPRASAAASSTPPPAS